MKDPLSSNQRCGSCGAPAPFKSVTTDAGMVYACERCSHHWFRAYGDDERTLTRGSEFACEKFVREAASDFCAVCGYRNIDHLRKRAAVETSVRQPCGPEDHLYVARAGSPVGDGVCIKCGAQEIK